LTAQLTRAHLRAGHFDEALVETGWALRMSPVDSFVLQSPETAPGNLAYRAKAAAMRGRASRKPWTVCVGLRELRSRGAGLLSRRDAPCYKGGRLARLRMGSREPAWSSFGNSFLLTAASVFS
jgi:hypothetical protein